MLRRLGGTGAAVSCFWWISATVAASKIYSCQSTKNNPGRRWNKCHCADPAHSGASNRFGWCNQGVPSITLLRGDFSPARPDRRGIPGPPSPVKSTHLDAISHATASAEKYVQPARCHDGSARARAPRRANRRDSAPEGYERHADFRAAVQKRVN